MSTRVILSHRKTEKHHTKDQKCTYIKIKFLETIFSEQEYKP